MDRFNKYWALTSLILIAIIIIGGIMLWRGYSASQPVEISLPSEPEWQSTAYIGGMVNNPGFYPVKPEDSLQDIIKAAGGTTSHADFTNLKIYIPQVGVETQPQKINLNRAETWLLEALPGIGAVKAQAIIDYRRQNGPFQNINELSQVDGIGIAIYEEIKHLVTVAD